MLYIFTERQCARLEIADSLSGQQRLPPQATDRDLDSRDG